MMMGDAEVDIYAGLSPARDQKICNGGRDDRLKMPPPPLPHDESSTSSTFDLYSDLIEEEENKPKEVVAQLQEVNVEKEGKITQLSSKIDNLQKENESLHEQNAALKKNISALLKTAKLEMKRKDWELMQLKLRSKNDIRLRGHFSNPIQPPPAPSDVDRDRCGHHADTINPNLIPLGKQRQLQRQSSHAASGSRNSPDTEVCLNSRHEILKGNSSTPPSKRIPRGPHTPPGEPPPSGSSAENSPVAVRSAANKSRSCSPIHNIKRPNLYERTNHDRSAHTQSHSSSKPTEHDKSDAHRNKEKKRKRNNDEDARSSSSRSTRRRDARHGDSSRDEKYLDREKELDRIRKESSRRRREKSVQKAKEAIFMSKISPLKESSKRDKYDQMRRNRAVSKERETRRSSRAISREQDAARAKSSRNRDKRSDREEDIPRLDLREMLAERLKRPKSRYESRMMEKEKQFLRDQEHEKSGRGKNSSAALEAGPIGTTSKRHRKEDEVAERLQSVKEGERESMLAKHSETKSTGVSEDLEDGEVSSEEICLRSSKRTKKDVSTIKRAIKTLCDKHKRPVSTRNVDDEVVPPNVLGRKDGMDKHTAMEKNSIAKVQNDSSTSEVVSKSKDMVHKENTERESVSSTPVSANVLGKLETVGSPEKKKLDEKTDVKSKSKVQSIEDDIQACLDIGELNYDDEPEDDGQSTIVETNPALSADVPHHPVLPSHSPPPLPPLPSSLPPPPPPPPSVPPSPEDAVGQPKSGIATHQDIVLGDTANNKDMVPKSKDLLTDHNKGGVVHEGAQLVQRTITGDNTGSEQNIVVESRSVSDGPEHRTTEEDKALSRKVYVDSLSNQDTQICEQRYIEKKGPVSMEQDGVQASSVSDRRLSEQDQSQIEKESTISQDQVDAESLPIQDGKMLKQSSVCDEKSSKTKPCLDEKETAISEEAKAESQDGKSSSTLELGSIEKENALSKAQDVVESISGQERESSKSKERIVDPESAVPRQEVDTESISVPNGKLSNQRTSVKDRTVLKQHESAESGKCPASAGKSSNSKQRLVEKGKEKSIAVVAESLSVEDGKSSKPTQRSSEKEQAVSVKHDNVKSVSVIDGEVSASKQRLLEVENAVSGDGVTVESVQIQSKQRTTEKEHSSLKEESISKSISISGGKSSEPRQSLVEKENAISREVKSMSVQNVNSSKSKQNDTEEVVATSKGDDVESISRTDINKSLPSATQIVHAGSIQSDLKQSQINVQPSAPVEVRKHPVCKNLFQDDNEKPGATDHKVVQSSKKKLKSPVPEKTSGVITNDGSNTGPNDNRKQTVEEGATLRRETPCTSMESSVPKKTSLKSTTKNDGKDKTDDKNVDQSELLLKQKSTSLTKSYVARKDGLGRTHEKVTRSEKADKNSVEDSEARTKQKAPIFTEPSIPSGNTKRTTENQKDDNSREVVSKPKPTSLTESSKGKKTSFRSTEEKDTRDHKEVKKNVEEGVVLLKQKPLLVKNTTHIPSTDKNDSRGGKGNEDVEPSTQIESVPGKEPNVNETDKTVSRNKAPLKDSSECHKSNSDTVEDGNKKSAVDIEQAEKNTSKAVANNNDVAISHKDDNSESKKSKEASKLKVKGQHEVPLTPAIRRKPDAPVTPSEIRSINLSFMDEDSRSGSPPLTYEFSPHFVETIEMPMRRLSTARLSTSMEGVQEGNTGDNVTSSKSVDTKASEDTAAAGHPSNVVGHQDRKTNEGHMKTNEGHTASCIVTGQELKRLEAEAERALNMIFSSRFSERIQKLKKTKNQEQKSTIKKAKGKEQVRKLKDRNPKDSHSRSKKHPTPPKQPITSSPKQPKQSTAALSKQSSTASANMQSTTASPNKQSTTASANTQSTTGSPSKQSTTASSNKQSTTAPPKESTAASVAIVAATPSCPETHPQSDKFDNSAVSASNENIAKQPAGMNTSKVQIPEVPASDKTAVVEDVLEIHTTDTSLLDDVFQESSEDTAAKEAVSKSASGESDRSKDKRSQKTTTPKVSSERSKGKGERSSRSERTKSSDSVSGTKDKESNKKHASSKRHSSSDENRWRKPVSGKERKKLHEYDDKERDRKDYPRLNHDRRDRSSRGAERPRPFRRDSSPKDRRKHNRDRSTHDRLITDRTRASKNDDIKSILRSVSVKIASEIDSLTARSRDRTRKRDRPETPLRLDKSQLGPWGCKDLREEYSPAEADDPKQLDTKLNKAEKKGSAKNVKTVQDDSLSEGEIVSESESEDLPINKRQRTFERDNCRKSPSVRHRDRRAPARQSPRLNSKSSSRRDEGKRKDDRSGVRTRGGKRRP